MDGLRPGQVFTPRILEGRSRPSHFRGWVLGSLVLVAVWNNNGHIAMVMVSDVLGWWKWRYGVWG